jgi:hypothetical protein
MSAVAEDRFGPEHKVREHMRNQWYPSLAGHKQIVISEHSATNPTKIWQLVGPDGEVFMESRDKLEIDIRLAIKGYEGKKAGWHVVESWRSRGAKSQRRPLNLLEKHHPTQKAVGTCIKALACAEPDTDEGETCPGCGKAFGRHEEWWAQS